jgi:hypothetical protein
VVVLVGLVHVRARAAVGVNCNNKQDINMMARIPIRCLRIKNKFSPFSFQAFLLGRPAY